MRPPVGDELRDQRAHACPGLHSITRVSGSSVVSITGGRFAAVEDRRLERGDREQRVGDARRARERRRVEVDALPRRRERLGGRGPPRRARPRLAWDGGGHRCPGTGSRRASAAPASTLGREGGDAAVASHAANLRPRQSPLSRAGVRPRLWLAWGRWRFRLRRQGASRIDARGSGSSFHPCAGERRLPPTSCPAPRRPTTRGRSRRRSRRVHRRRLPGRDVGHRPRAVRGHAMALTETPRRRSGCSPRRC